MPEHSDGRLQTIFSNPAAFPHALDFARDELVFVITNRKILSQSSFLDGRTALQQAGGEEVRVSLNSFLDFHAGQKTETYPASRNFIFHTGFCCSSLLARCLDKEGACLALKEPNILNDVAEARRLSFGHSSDFSHWQRTASLIFSLLLRSFSEGEKVVIKPSNVDNILISDILKADPEAQVVLLYQSLKNFLIAVAKGGKPRRQFIRRLLARLLLDLNSKEAGAKTPLPFSEQALWSLDDLHLAAVVWYLQMETFKEIEARFSGSRLRMQSCRDFMADPAGTTKNLCDFFRLDGSLRNLKTTLSQHAKAPEFTYSSTIRLTEFQAIENYLQRPLAETLDWADEVLFAEPWKTLPKIAI